MKDDDDLAGLFDPRLAPQVNANPIQRPGLDRLLRTATTGGPELGGDRRLYLAADLLERVLDVARASPLGRAEISRVGIRIDLYERPDGHRYEVWTLIGTAPRPEPLPEFFGSKARA